MHFISKEGKPPVIGNKRNSIEDFLSDLLHVRAPEYIKGRLSAKRCALFSRLKSETEDWTNPLIH